MCAFLDEYNKSTKNRNYFADVDVLTLYNKACVIINDTCHLFTWFTNQNLCAANKYNLTSKITNTTHFQILFDAVDVEFPPIITQDKKVIVSYKKYSYIYDYKYKPIDQGFFEGLYILSQGELLRITGGNLQVSPFSLTADNVI